MSRMRIACVVLALCIAGPAFAQESLLEYDQRMRRQSQELDRADQDRFDRRNSEYLRSIEEDRRAREVSNELRSIRGEIDAMRRQRDLDRFDRETGVR